MDNEVFRGDRKVGVHLLHNWERAMVAKWVSHVPKSIETYHLTLCTLLLSGLIIACFVYAQKNVQWLWGVSVIIVLQYITDLFDGEVGRYRKTGLIRWGYYMDHLMDYCFLCALFIGYAIVLPQRLMPMLFLLFMLCGAFMVQTFLAFGSTNKLRISYFRIGPTELRIVLIGANTYLIFTDWDKLGGLLPSIIVGVLLTFIFVVYRTQSNIWQNDLGKEVLNKKSVET